MITEPSRTTEKSSTLIDLIITNRPDNITNKGVFPNSIADHDMIACSRKINNICYNPKTIKCRNYTNYSPEELKSDVAKIDWSPVYDATDVDLAVQYFTSSLQLVFETHAPHIEKRVKGRPCPWLDIDTKKLMNRRDQTLRKASKYKSNDDWKSCKTLRNKCNKQIKKAKSNHHKKVLNDNINKPKKFWSLIKNVFPGKSQSMANVSTDKRASLNILSRFYSTMASKLKNPVTYLQILPSVILQNLH